jgi:hypothetical protein
VSLFERLENDFKEALKARDDRRVSILRMLKAAIKNREIEKGASLSDEEIYGVLSSFVKRARESIDQFSKGGRTDLAEKEREELRIIQAYLPEQLSEEELKGMVREVIEEVGASGMGDLGRVMKVIMPRVKGRADGRMVNTIVKEVLQGG